MLRIFSVVLNSAKRDENGFWVKSSIPGDLLPARSTYCSVCDRLIEVSAE